jgi:hypothetical protein
MMFDFQIGLNIPYQLAELIVSIVDYLLIQIEIELSHAMVIPISVRLSFEFFA